jgi:hypothetical protein
MRVTAESPWNPSTTAPQSIEITVPSSSTTSADGMPWTIWSSREVHRVAGNPR